MKTAHVLLSNGGYGPPFLLGKDAAFLQNGISQQSHKSAPTEDSFHLLYANIDYFSGPVKVRCAFRAVSSHCSRPCCKAFSKLSVAFLKLSMLS
jgi:hypothetical protein